MGLHFVQGEERLHAVGQLSFAARKLLCDAREVRKASEDLLERAFQLLLVGNGGSYDEGQSGAEAAAAQDRRALEGGRRGPRPSCT